MESKGFQSKNGFITHYYKKKFGLYDKRALILDSSSLMWQNR